MKKVLASGLLLSTVVSSSLFADTFSWQEYKKTLPDDIIKENKYTDEEKTKNYIKKRYNVSVDKRTLEEIKREQRSKNLEVSALFRGSQDYKNASGEDESTSNFGIGITGRFDLMAIGKKLDDTYAEIDVWDDSVWMGLGKRIQSDTRMGFFGDYGAGVVFQMKDTVREEDLYLYTYARLGWNFDDFTLKAGINVPSDAFSDGFVDNSIIMFSIGWRF